jgi:hypothetical protein
MGIFPVALLAVDVISIDALTGRPVFIVDGFMKPLVTILAWR